MDNDQLNKGKIAKNTLLLYFRMFLILAISLYTSRVVLDKLGVEDYALYNVVGGLVGMLSFLNSTLSAGTSRFLTYDLGRGDIRKLQLTFNTTFYVHLTLALLIIFFMETGGMWYMYNKLVVPDERFIAAMWIFQLSLFTTFISITQVPYSSAIMAHEDMSIYAYVGMVEVVLKLLIVFLIIISPIDKLITYSSLVAVVQISVALFYRFYCTKRYTECALTKAFDRNTLKSMLGFTGWSTIANLSETLNLQGSLLLLNLFFSPVVVSAQSIGNQISTQLMQFTSNFRIAVNPQIVKQYAVGNYDLSRKITLNSTIYLLDLMLLISVPFVLLADKILNIWLVEVPEYAIIFVQLIVIEKIISTVGASFYMPMVASGSLKSNSLSSVFLGVGRFLILYILFRLGADVLWLQYTAIISSVLSAFCVKPVILHKELLYPIKEVAFCIVKCILIIIFSFSIPVLFQHSLSDSLINAIVVLLISVINVIMIGLIFLSSQERKILYKYISDKIVRR